MSYNILLINDCHAPFPIIKLHGKNAHSKYFTTHIYFKAKKNNNFYFLDVIYFTNYINDKNKTMCKRNITLFMVSQMKKKRRVYRTHLTSKCFSSYRLDYMSMVLSFARKYN